MIARSLKVPYAVDRQDKLVSIKNADPPHYFCPACGVALVHKHGLIKVHHFAHKISENCSLESILHIVAKRLIQEAIRDWKAGRGPIPLMNRHCAICAKAKQEPISERVLDAVFEYRHPEGIVSDVALGDGEGMVAAVEIWVTHKVDEEKAAVYPVPFVELDAEAVIEDPPVWTPLIDGFDPCKCGLAT